MGELDANRKGTAAREISAALSGRRFAMWGYPVEEGQSVTRFLSLYGAIALPVDERMLSDSARFCDGVLFKLSSASPPNLRLAATKSTAPVLVTGSPEHILQGVGGAYDWPADL